MVSSVRDVRLSMVFRLPTAVSGSMGHLRIQVGRLADVARVGTVAGCTRWVDGLVDAPRLDGPACYHPGIGIVKAVLNLERRLVVVGLSYLTSPAFGIDVNEVPLELGQEHARVPALEREERDLLFGEWLRGDSLVESCARNLSSARESAKGSVSGREGPVVPGQVEPEEVLQHRPG